MDFGALQSSLEDLLAVAMEKEEEAAQHQQQRTEESSRILHGGLSAEAREGVETLCETLEQMEALRLQLLQFAEAEDSGSGKSGAN